MAAGNGRHLVDHSQPRALTVVTRWDSLESIRSFAGSDIERAVVEPGAAAALVEFDARVRHYEVLEELIA